MSGARRTDGTADAPFLAAVAVVQRLVGEDAPPERIYRAVLDEALHLLDGDAGSLRLVDPADPGWMLAVADSGCEAVRERWRRRAPVSEGLSGRVIRSGRPVSVAGGPGDAAPLGSKLAPPGIRLAIGHPILESGKVVGSLVVASLAEARRWSRRDRTVIGAFASHASAALTVVKGRQDALGATHDGLTGLGTRTLLLDRLEHRLAAAEREDKLVSVLFVDLDGFKLVNDSLGRVYGDQLLAGVAGRIQGCTRRGDVCARLGGDEFAVLLRDGSAAEKVAHRIISSLRRPFAIGGREVFVNVSIGVAFGHAEADTMLRNADVAMYHAKRAGGGRYAVFETSMHAARVSRLGLDAELRHVIERGELVLHYQPQYDLSTGQLSGFESLVRWRHRDRGLVPPLQWIPLAEETGLIVEVDRWVLEEACRQFAAWWRIAPLALSVNVSARDLMQADYPAIVEHAIGGRFPSSALILEATETVALQNSGPVLSQLSSVKELGVRVALDDFGTGHATLLSLAQLPIDVLKIARPFVEAAGQDRGKGRALLAGTIEMGRHLGVAMVGEGIETEDQRALLAQLGCDIGQGFLLGRPLEPAAAEALLRPEALLGAC